MRDNLSSDFVTSESDQAAVIFLSNLYVAGQNGEQAAITVRNFQVNDDHQPNTIGFVRSDERL